MEVNATEFQNNIFQFLRNAAAGEPITIKHKTLGAFDLIPKKSIHQTIKLGALKGRGTINANAFDGWSDELESMFDSLNDS